MIENSWFTYVALTVIGLCAGSFVGATVWRFRSYLLAYDKKQGEKVDESEFKRLKKLSKKSFLTDRSVCLNCSYKLRWYDLIPIISWVSLGGKCRKCRRPIGYIEPLLEISMALFFFISFVLWPIPMDGYLAISQFILWLLSGVILAIIFVYDLKWLEIPTILNYSIIGLGAVNLGLVMLNSNNYLEVLTSASIGALILSGLYLLIYFISRQRWIGFGDVLLGLGMAFLLVDWELSYLALLLANLIGCIFIIPGILSGKLKRTSKIPFGPFLILGLVIAKLVGYKIIEVLFFSYL